MLIFSSLFTAFEEAFWSLIIGHIFQPLHNMQNNGKYLSQTNTQRWWKLVMKYDKDTLIGGNSIAISSSARAKRLTLNNWIWNLWHHKSFPGFATTKRPVWLWCHLNRCDADALKNVFQGQFSALNWLIFLAREFVTLVSTLIIGITRSANLPPLRCSQNQPKKSRAADNKEDHGFAV